MCHFHECLQWALLMLILLTLLVTSYSWLFAFSSQRLPHTTSMNFSLLMAQGICVVYRNKSTSLVSILLNNISTSPSNHKRSQSGRVLWIPLASWQGIGVSHTFVQIFSAKAAIGSGTQLMHHIHKPVAYYTLLFPLALPIPCCSIGLKLWRRW